MPNEPEPRVSHSRVPVSCMAATSRPNSFWYFSSALAQMLSCAACGRAGEERQGHTRRPRARATAGSRNQLSRRQKIRKGTGKRGAARGRTSTTRVEMKPQLGGTSGTKGPWGAERGRRMNTLSQAYITQLTAGHRRLPPAPFRPWPPHSTTWLYPSSLLSARPHTRRLSARRHGPYRRDRRLLGAQLPAVRLGELEGGHPAVYTLQRTCSCKQAGLLRCFVPSSTPFSSCAPPPRVLRLPHPR